MVLVFLLLYPVGCMLAHMKRFFRNLVYERPGKFHNPLMHPFLLITAVMGLSFVFFHGTGPVEASVLYQLTVGHLPDVAVSIWGVIALVLTLAHIVAIQVRKRWLGSIVTWTGTLLWLYATILYALFGFWLQVFTAGVPSLFFWIWYSIYVTDYHDVEDKLKDN